MYDKIKKVYLPSAVLNPDGTAAVVLTLLPNAKEKMWVFGAGAYWSTAVTANGFNTTAPVFAVSYDAANAGSPVEKGTLTVALNAAKAVGKEDQFTDLIPFIVDRSAGDALEFSVKTQGTGATTTGDAVPWILVAYEHKLVGAP